MSVMSAMISCFLLFLLFLKARPNILIIPLALDDRQWHGLENEFYMDLVNGMTGVRNGMNGIEVVSLVRTVTQGLLGR